MKNAKWSSTIALVTGGMIVLSGTHPTWAGYKAAVSTSGYGNVQASLENLDASKTSLADTYLWYRDAYLFEPSAAVTDQNGTWKVQVEQPIDTPLVCTSTVRTVRLTGGYKALARSYVTTGVSSDNHELKQKLIAEKFVLTPNYCGAAYNIASGDEYIDGKRYLVVLGQATGGTAAWFRTYIFDGIPKDRNDLINNGVKLNEALVKGPFDFGDVESEDRCKAMKVPIEYDGPDVFIVSDGLAESTTDLQFVDCPTSVTIGCNDPLVYGLTTVGGCGAASITYDPPAELLPPGSTLVTATATDGVGNVAVCKFTAIRPLLGFNGFYSPISGTGGDCTSPIRLIKAGNKIPIKFDTTFCGLSYQSIIPPIVTITKISGQSPDPCAVLDIPVDHQYFQWVANQWHFNWNSLKTDAGFRFRIEVDLGDGQQKTATVELF